MDPDQTLTPDSSGTHREQSRFSELGELYVAVVERALLRAFGRERALLESALVQLFLDRAGTQSTLPVAPGDERVWTGVESLSRLRALVGGRFQQLKQRWIDAGLPLRAHRGDRTGRVEIDRDGWLELAAWIQKQGFEARLTNEISEFLFEVRSLQSAEKR